MKRLKNDGMERVEGEGRNREENSEGRGKEWKKHGREKVKGERI